MKTEIQVNVKIAELYNKLEEYKDNALDIKVIRESNAGRRCSIRDKIIALEWVLK